MRATKIKKAIAISPDLLKCTEVVNPALHVNINKHTSAMRLTKLYLLGRCGGIARYWEMETLVSEPVRGLPCSLTPRCDPPGFFSRPPLRSRGVSLSPRCLSRASGWDAVTLPQYPPHNRMGCSVRLAADLLNDWNKKN